MDSTCQVSAPAQKSGGSGEGWDYGEGLVCDRVLPSAHAIPT